MSKENVEIVRAANEAFLAGDVETALAALDPDVEWQGLIEVFRGHDGARRGWDRLRADVELKVHFDDIRDLGESLLALGEARAIGQRSGLHLTAEIAQLARFRDGRIVTLRDFARHAEALEATGLGP